MTLAATPRAAAQGASVVFSMVSDGDALAQVCAGENGILAGLSAGSIYVDLSTVGPVASEAARIATEERGCPVPRRAGLGQRVDHQGRAAPLHGGRRGGGA